MKRIEAVYGSPSAIRDEEGKKVVDLRADARRPVRLHGRVVRDVFPIRLALETLGSLVLDADDAGASEPGAAYDPVVTVHADRVVFEAFGGRGTSYARASVDTRVFAIQGEVSEGTTTVDASPWLWEALPDLRTSQRPLLRLDGKVERDRGSEDTHTRCFELDGAWLRRVLELQVASVACEPEAETRPEAWLEDASVRRRCRRLLPLVAHARRVRVFSHGPGWPSYRLVDLPSVSVLVVSAPDEAWSYAAGTSLAEVAPAVPPEFLAPVLTALVEHRALSVERAVAHTGLEPARAKRALDRLCRAGRALYEPEHGVYRHRELFALPLDVASLESLDPTLAAAEALVRDGAVEVLSVQRRVPAPEGKGRRRAETTVAQGRVGGDLGCQVAIREGGKVVFGSCGCSHFRAWLMSRGPCEHMIALALVARDRQSTGGSLGSG